MSASVTVSIGDDTNGVFSRIERVKWDDRSTSVVAKSM